jgi:DNA invertase Pin-like site-specific DNA recombinase
MGVRSNQNRTPGGRPTMKHIPSKIIGYVRTSTDDQLIGIDAQRVTLDAISKARRCEVARIYEEHESGGDNDRLELDKALRHARRLKAYLVVAKLDRLARDQQFLMKLVDSGVDIMFGDLPDVDPNTDEGRMFIQMFGSYAEFERRRIGTRTREALRIVKGRGTLLGAANPKCRNLTAEGRARGIARSARNRTARAIEDQSDIASVASEMRSKGDSLRTIAAHLNAEGYPTREGSQRDEASGKGGWSAVQVKRVLDRIKAASV